MSPAIAHRATVGFFASALSRSSIRYQSTIRHLSQRPLRSARRRNEISLMTEMSRVTAGIGLAVAGNACFAIQDAIVKWLVASHSVWQILFVRSVVIMAF